MRSVRSEDHLKITPGVAAWTSGPWSLKLVYLWFYLGSAAYVTFVALYLRSIHLTGAQIGFVASIVPLAGVALQPVWGLLSDRRRWRKRVLALSLLASSILAVAVTQAGSFATLLPLVVALAVAISPAIPLADASTLESIGRRGGSYGAIRIYGSIGFLIGSMIAGPLLSGDRIRLLFPFYGLCLAGGFLVSLAAPPQRPATGAAHHLGVRLVLRDPVVTVFLVLVGLAFGSSAAYNTFFVLYMHGLGASTTVVGFAAALASVSELPVMALSGRVVARYGAKALLLVGLGAATLRWLMYGLVQDYRLAVAFQLLHGLSFAASYVAGVTFVDRQVPPHLRSTGQTLFYGATFGVGAVAGANLFGALYDRLGAHGIFLVAAGICALAAVGLALSMPGREAPAATIEGREGRRRVGRIVVVGSLNMDLVVRVSRWPDAGETLIGEDFDQGPGGKGANQAAAAAVAGGSVSMVGAVGDDAFGETLRANLAGLGVNVEAVSSRSDTRTGVALIGVDASGENRIVVVSGANAELEPDEVERSVRSGAWDGASVLLLQCEIPARTVLSACRLARSRGLTVVLDPAPPIELPPEIWSLVDICTPNQGEAAALTGGEVKDLAGARRAGEELRSRGVGAALVKLGADGVLVLDDRRCLHVPGIAVEVVDTTAAGDVFAGALAVALAEGRDLPDAVSFANRAGALSTTRRGAQTSLPRREEIDRLGER